MTLRPAVLVASSVAIVGVCGAAAWVVLPERPHAPRVRMIAATSSPHWSDYLNGARAAAKRYNVDLEITAADDSCERCAANTSPVARTESRPDAVIVCPTDPSSDAALIDRLAETTQVVTCGLDAPTARRGCHVGPGNFGAGRRCANVIRELLPDGGKVAVLYEDCRDNFAQRLDGLVHVLHAAMPSDEARRWIVAAQVADHGLRDTCADRLRQAMMDHPDLDCIVCFGARQCDVAVDILAERESGAVKLLVFDPEESTLDMLASGQVDAVFADDHFQIGYAAIVQATALARYEGLEQPVAGRGSSYFPPRTITADNLAAYRARGGEAELAAN